MKLPLIDESGHIPRLVVVFPVRHDNHISRTTFQDLCQQTVKKHIYRLIVIDKTGGTFFESKIKEFKTLSNLCYLKRSCNDNLFMSLREITLLQGEWLAQVHDDDCIEGKIEFSGEAGGGVQITPVIYTRKRNFKRKLIRFEELDNWPMSTLFSFTPWSLWNEFANYLRAQGKFVSATSDIGLNYVASQLLLRKEMQSYIYTYDVSKWANRYSRVKSMKAIMLSEGFAKESDLSFMHLIQLVDKFALSIWLEKFAKFKVEKSLAESSFRLIKFSWRQTLSHLIALAASKITFLLLANISRVFSNPIELSVWQQKIFIKSKFREVQKCNSSHQLAHILMDLVNNTHSSEVTQRLNFLTSQILSFPELFKS